MQTAELLLFEANELALYEIHKEFTDQLTAEEKAATKITPLMGSILDRDLLERVFANWQIDVVYHAAAYKHVSLVEQNISASLLNNVFGTLNVTEMAEHGGVAHFILVSTDKAVRPTNVMGGTKRIAEMILQAKAELPGQKTQFSMVRFGNVLGSSGSVVPRFRKQISAGGPVTVTHKDACRYFMTIPEAAQLVMQAGTMADGGDVFVLDMGKPVVIYDMARRLIELSGKTVRSDDNPHGDIEITFTGLLPGEKMIEELLIGDNPQRTDHPRIMRAFEEHLPWDKMQVALEQLRAAADANDIEAVRELFGELVSGYRASEDMH